VTPLLLATLGYAAGLLAGLRIAPTGLATALLAIAVALLFSRRSRSATLLAFVTAGTVIGGVRAEAVRRDCRMQLPDGTHVRLAGVPRVVPTEGVTTPFTAVLTVVEARDVVVASCRVTVRVRASAVHLPLLDSAARGTAPALLIHGRWAAWPRRGGWPRKPEHAGAVLLDSVRPLPATQAAGVPAAGAASAAIPAASAAIPAASAATRFRTAQQTRLRALLPERWGLAEALLLAQRAGLAPETRSRWVAAGLVHLLAISGMHVGLIVGGMLIAGRLCGLAPGAARRLAVLVTAAYVLFLGAPSAALRAMLQASLLLGAAELQRPAEPFTALAAAALVILLIEPMAILDPGFQLSFAGMIGLIGWRRPVAGLLPRRLHPHIRDGIAAGVAASALTTPIAALQFGTAAWIGIPASILAVPLLAAAVAALLVALLIAALTGSVTGVHAAAADLPLRLLDATAGLAARVPGGHGYMAASTVVAILGAVAIMIIVRRALHGRGSGAPPPSHAPDAAHVAWRGRRRLYAFRVGAAAAAGVLVLAWSPQILRPHGDRIEIHAIDVGQGDAFAIRTPANRWILVDAGPRTLRSDAGRDRVVPYLLKHGARRIEALILTHPDADHIGGAAAVLDAFDVALVIDPGFAAGKDMFIDLVAAARRSDRRWIAAREGIRLAIDGVDIALLYPFSSLDAARDANDNSVVFSLSFGSFTALFLGDAPRSVEEQVVARHGGRLRAEVLKVGHHGSNTSTGEVLLRAARPGLALVSAGRNNRYGHPAPGVLQRLADHEVRVLRTDVHGNITVRAARTGRTEVLAR
jgi:competence protein ComEC